VIEFVFGAIVGALVGGAWIYREVMSAVEQYAEDWPVPSPERLERVGHKMAAALEGIEPLARGTIGPTSAADLDRRIVNVSRALDAWRDEWGVGRHQ
jgi:hypothetical protein